VRYLSVCSGIEAATVAWHPLGWEAAAYSEIEKFPSQVLAHHYPNTPNVGDMTKFKEWTNVSDVNVLVGGTPCQSFSVAGLRKGLDDPRGNLMLTYLAIAAKYRPKWLVWENVPGVLSSNGGLDFASLLRGMGELGYGFAYRILDAQYFGVAQRRRRVFVVGYAGNWRPAAAVLFERHSMCGYPAPSREKGQGVAASTGASPVYGGSDPNTADTVTSKWAKGSGGPAGNECGLFVAQPIASHDVADTVPTLTSNGDAHCGFRDEHGLVPMVQPMPINTMVALRHEALGEGTGFGIGAAGDPAYTITKGHSHAVAQPVHCIDMGGNKGLNGGGILRELSQPLSTNESHAIQQAMAVRRLSPKECERLQGFPDNYTDIKLKGKPTPDGPRYKALGNSMAVPVMAWIGKRIQEVEAINAP
jgi:DNA (cytosine-5)-methyltransferase 1